MALSNTDRVGRVMDALKEGLAPYIVREFIRVYDEKTPNEIDSIVTTNAYDLPNEAFNSQEELIAELDTQRCLKIMWDRWNDVFNAKLSRTARSYVSELIEARNKWAHQVAYTTDDAERTADTASRLLEMIAAPTEANKVREIRLELARLRFDVESKKTVKKTEAESPTTGATTTPGLKPWRLVIEPHTDVAAGRYSLAEFAADLSQVVAGRAGPEYGDAREFFRRTYLTKGLVALVASSVHRLSANGGDPVVQLQTPFGGGKTHSMLAIYHIVGGGIKLSEIPGGEALAEQIGNIDLPDAKRAVLVGTALDPSKPRQLAEVTLHTMWGEIAYQIGGLEGYGMVENADLNGVNPGSETLRELLEKYGPALIILDEFVAYARNIYGVNGLPSGSFDSLMSFMQSLTEAVRQSTDSMLLISLPKSDEDKDKDDDSEIGGPHGREALRRLEKITARLETVWRPVEAMESFEIVRRRLFSPNMDYAARDAVLNHYRDLYRANQTDFPAGVAEGDYFERMKSAYPIHPELFERLYIDWSTLDKFQRTRGVLQLMAEVIHELWKRDDKSLMIMPGSLPLDAPAVRNRLLKYLPESWSAVIDSDVDGEHARPVDLDGKVPALGRFSAARRVARAIFAGTAPNVHHQAVRGMEEGRVCLGVVQPGENVAVFTDALRRMGNSLTYLYSDGSRYWYDTHPTVNRLAQERASSVKPHEADTELMNRLRKIQLPRGDIRGVHAAPESSADVGDDPTVRIVVLPPGRTYKRNNGTSEAIKMAMSILQTRGGSPRLFPNMLVFIAPDEGEEPAVRTAVSTYLAWLSINNDKETLNLDAQQRRQVERNLQEASQTTDKRLMEVYRWLLVPRQPDPANAVQIEWVANNIGGDDNLYVRAARKLRQNEDLIPLWAPKNLRMEMDRRDLWRGSAHTPLRTLWNDFISFIYLPRLRDQDVLLATIREGIGDSDAPFAYAAGIDAKGDYMGLVYRGTGSVVFDANSLLVHPDAAEAQIARQESLVVPEKEEQDEGKGGKKRGDRGPEPIRPVLKRAPTYYHGTKHVDSQRPQRDLDQLVKEVVEHLTGLKDAEVEITVEINARSDSGFDDTTVRIISENAQSLKFSNSEFEDPQ